jgi:hypothetical protein
MTSMELVNSALCYQHKQIMSAEQGIIVSPNDNKSFKNIVIIFKGCDSHYETGISEWLLVRCSSFALMIQMIMNEEIIT